MASTSILTLLVALSALTIFSNGMPQYGPGAPPPGFDGKEHGWSHMNKYSNHNVTHDNGKSQYILLGMYLGDINSQHTITTDGQATHYEEHHSWK